MRKGNGRPEVDNVSLDLEHEVPASSDSSENTGSSGAQPSAAASESQKLQAEVDSLRDRLARRRAERKAAEEAAKAREEPDHD